MGGSLKEHNERDFTPLPMGMTRKQAIAQAKVDLDNGVIDKRPHFAPDYLLNVTHPPGNESFNRMTIEDVTEEYMTSTTWGQKHKKFHHKASPFREAIVVFEAHHTLEDFEALADRLESELEIQVMYGHLHRDEGHINDSGDAVFNFHAHIGFTNLKDGKLNHFDNIKCARAQDICAEVLNMERGEIGSQVKALDHREFRVSERYAVQVEKDLKNAVSGIFDEQSTDIKQLNKQVRGLLKDNSALADALDEEKTKAIKYQETSQATKAKDIEKLQALLNEATANNRRLNEKLEAKDAEKEKAEENARRLEMELKAEKAKLKLVDAAEHQIVEELETRTLSEAVMNGLKNVWERAKKFAENTRLADSLKSVGQEASQEQPQRDNEVARRSPRRRGR